MTVSVRFAPSPTGSLHVGNIQLALVNWLFARKAGGNFMLRLDDTDLERSTPAFAAGIENDLAWLGLNWDRHVRQSDRLARYVAAGGFLCAMGRLYPCYETADELAAKRKSQLARGQPPIYDRAALQLTADDRARMEKEGREPHWRFLLLPEPVAWTDLVRGPVRFESGALSDPVLVREDARPLYTLCSVVDDLELGISHVVRGEDHVTNTAVQIQLFQALGGAVPAFAHLPLLTDAAGQGLSKRLGSLSVASLRDEHGIEPLALLSLLARLGTSDAIEPAASLAELVESFALERVSRATPRFDPDELRRLNARIVHGLPFAAVADRLEALGCTGAEEAFWLAVRTTLERVPDAREWWPVVAGPITPVIEEGGLAAQAAALLPPEPWDGDSWGIWIERVKQATGAKGKALFHPLRLALTGCDHGPELKNLLPLIGRARAAARLSGQAA